MSDFEIYLDSDNELTFSVEIQGAESSPVRSQFIVETPRGINLAFEGKSKDCEITVDVPSLKGMLTEGTYNTRLEVIVDDRIFVPLSMEALIKPTVKVEAVVRSAQKVTAPSVTASVVSRKKQKTISESLPTRVSSFSKKSNVQTNDREHARTRSKLDKILDTLENL